MIGCTMDVLQNILFLLSQYSINILFIKLSLEPSKIQFKEYKKKKILIKEYYNRVFPWFQFDIRINSLYGIKTSQMIKSVFYS